jgi:uncharacterized alkaline shock family protein YloU
MSICNIYSIIIYRLNIKKQDSEIQKIIKFHLWENINLNIRKINIIHLMQNVEKASAIQLAF